MCWAMRGGRDGGRRSARDARSWRTVGEALVALPVFATSPLYRRWHLRWGATDEEASAGMPGDAVVPVSHFTATRAVTIGAPPEAVWPWIMQVGFRRAGST